MKKIAVMLPIGYRGGSLRAAKNIAKSIAFQARKHGDDIQVIFSYVKDGKYDIHRDFNDLKQYGVSLRETVWQVYERSVIIGALPIINLEERQLVYETYCIPTDGANDFFDCDLWIIISDRLPAPLLPVKKYLCVIYDYLQRYVPQIWENALEWDMQESIKFSLVQNAAKVFVTTPSTHADLIAYAGVPDFKISMIAMDFEPLQSINSSEIRGKIDELQGLLSKEYFIWTTNATYHKNHVNAFRALEIYYNELGGEMDVVITGLGSQYFSPNKNPFDLTGLQLNQIKIVRETIGNSLGLKKHIHALGHVQEPLYIELLLKAKFLWHPTLYDNGTFSVIEAAYLQRPSLSARYPATEYINQKFKLNLSFFDAHNVDDMASSLSVMEKKYISIELPTQANLIKHSWQNNSSTLFQSIGEFL